MKGTIREIVGQESGFILYKGSYNRETAILDNWVSDATEYPANLRKTRKIKNCLFFLVNRGIIRVDGDDVVKEYREDANPVTLEDLMVEGLLYDFEDFYVLVPDGWN